MTSSNYLHRLRSRIEWVHPAGLLSLAVCLVLNTNSAGSAELLELNIPGVKAWWALSSATKIQPNTPAPRQPGTGILIQSAKNETEAAQLVIRSETTINDFRLVCRDLKRESGSSIPSSAVEILQVHFLNIIRASDGSTKAGWWPDPLVPVTAPLTLGAGSNHVFWLRVRVPKETVPGKYVANIAVDAEGLAAEVPLHLEVFNFSLPDRMTCETAFGFSPNEVFRYHGLKSDEQKRVVLEKYLANMAAHHVSPYDPAPLNPIKIAWPDVQPPRTTWNDWIGLRFVTNEVHGGTSALLLNDDQPGQNVTVIYDPLIPIPKSGLRLRVWYRTPVPGHRFSITFNHHDVNRQWMSGRNNDLVYAGSGQWQRLEETFTNFPSGAAYVRFNARATTWTEQGERLGLVWLDDLSLTDLDTGHELLPGGDFERRPRTEPVVSPEKLKVKMDFGAWDEAMERAMNVHQFTTFQLHYPGLGGGTFHEIEGPSLLGFHETDPEYPLLMASYGTQIEQHLRSKGWLDRAFVYWFDEPTPDQYPFVMNGFAKLKRYSPGVTRMLTEQVEDGLIGGPNLWCPISNEYRHERAEDRRREGDRFWWYVCTGPKAPYAGLFTDHGAPEMRIWVWQTWQRKIQGLLVWQMNYWSSSAAYPDASRPQNPYEDPMSWTSGYSTPAGQRLPWGNGDGRFIYPPLAAASGDPKEPVLEGPVDSIRWEHLRDGIEDYEYFVILRNKLNNANSLNDSEKRRLETLLVVPENVSRSMTEFAPDGAPLGAHRRAMARAIEKLNQ